MAEIYSIENLLNVSFSSRKYEEKLEIIKQGKPMPQICLTAEHKDRKRSYTRHFTTANYNSIDWVTGCNRVNKLFCWPCILFSSEKSVWNFRGFSDLNHLSVAQQRHEKSQSHVQSYFSMKMFGKQRIECLVDKQLKENISKHNAEVSRNRNVLRRFIDTVCLLGQQELPFRGHDESHSSFNKGNYVEYLELLRTYDPLLDSHLNEQSVFRGTSPSIQNDIITAVADVLRDQIMTEIDSALFVAIMLDETSDVVNRSQLSTVLRYVFKGKVYERFIGFTDVSSDRTSDGLFKHVKNIVAEYKLSEKLVGQTYDGASVMSGHLNGLQSKVLSVYPNAIFTHCYAHVLNLVLQQSLTNIRECRNFFQTLSSLATFFSKSSKRVHALHEFVKRKLPSAAPTRWNFTSRLCHTVKEYKTELIDFFKYITDNTDDWDADTTLKSQGFSVFLNKSLTQFLVDSAYTDSLFNILQSKTNDILYCSNQISEVKTNLERERENSFDNIWRSFENLNSSIQDDNNSSKRTRLDENVESNARRLYKEIIDNICQQIHTRFKSFSNLEFFDLLSYIHYKRYSQIFPDNLLNKLKNIYGAQFDYVRLKNELIVVYNTKEMCQKSPHELLNYFEENSLENCFKEVHKILILILTIPATTASVERSFSALKRIHTHCRSTQSQERLTDLSMLYIEKELMCTLRRKEDASFYDLVTNKFLSQKRRIELTYK